MESAAEARVKILTEILSDDSEVRGEYIKHFKGHAEAFAGHMFQAIMAWRQLDENSGENEKRAYVSALVFAAITLHIQSLKVLFAGQPVASGNLFRRVVESNALALLCSHKDLPVLQRFIEDTYSTNKAVRDVLARWKTLGLIEAGAKALSDAQEFYHKYSHPSKLTIATVTSFSTEGLYVGASFDEGKLEAYAKEVNGRTNLAEVFVSFIEAVRSNVAKWR